MSSPFSGGRHHQASNNNSMMMFDDLSLEDMNTGSSLQQNQNLNQQVVNTAVSTKHDTQEFSDECMRVTTTEVNDIFDDEIWNPSAGGSDGCAQALLAAINDQDDSQGEIDSSAIHRNEGGARRENPEEEYFRLVRKIRLLTFVCSNFQLLFFCKWPPDILVNFCLFMYVQTCLALKIELYDLDNDATVFTVSHLLTLAHLFLSF